MIQLFPNPSRTLPQEAGIHARLSCAVFAAMSFSDAQSLNRVATQWDASLRWESAQLTHGAWMNAGSNRRRRTERSGAKQACTLPAAGVGRFLYRPRLCFPLKHQNQSSDTKGIP